MKADVFRYAMIFRDGGLYADVDMECLKPVGSILAGGTCTLSVEAHLGRTRQRELGCPRGVRVKSPRRPGTSILPGMNRSLSLSPMARIWLSLIACRIEA
jgi:hypothetical protein